MHQLKKIGGYVTKTALVFVPFFAASGASVSAQMTSDTGEVELKQEVTAEAEPAKSQEDGLFARQPVAEADLAKVTGREASDAMVANSQNSAVVSGNSIGDNSTTGDVSVTDNAFSNVSGISMINMNTGNASSINAAMNVNLQINYAAPGQ